MIRSHFHSTQHQPALNEVINGFVSSILWPEGNKRFQPNTFCSLGVERRGEIIAGVIYHNTDEDAGTIELSSAATSRSWMTKKVINCIFSVTFDMLGMQMCVLRVHGENDNMISIGRRLGFNEFIIPNLAGRGVPQHIFTMSDLDWSTNPLNISRKSVNLPK